MCTHNAHGHRFVKRIPIWRRTAAAETVRGLTQGRKGSRLYISTTRRLAAVDAANGRVLWERDYGGHCCERMALSPDDRVIYAPAFGRAVWYVVDAATGKLLTTVSVIGWPRSTIHGPGNRAYLAAWESNRLLVLDTASNAIVKEVGPFTGSLCPFTLNRRGTLAFANVDGLVGFEVADVSTGLILDRVQVDDYPASDVATYECPSHGIAFRPDETELGVADGVGNQLRIFNATPYPPVEKTSMQLSRQPRWITFSLDGRYAYSSTGDVIDATTQTIVAVLKDEHGTVVESERMVEIDRPSPSPM